MHCPCSIEASTSGQPMQHRRVIEHPPQAGASMQQILQPWLRFYRLRQISRDRLARGR